MGGGCGWAAARQRAFFRRSSPAAALIQPATSWWVWCVNSNEPGAGTTLFLRLAAVSTRPLARTGGLPRAEQASQPGGFVVSRDHDS